MSPVVPRLSHAGPARLSPRLVALAAAATLATAGAATTANAAAGATGGVAASTAKPPKAKAKSKSQARSKTKDKAKKRAKAKAQSSPTFVSDYAGPTGAIFHRRHSAAGPAGSSGSSRYEEEAWFEIGGGRRDRTVGTYGPIDASGNYISSGTTEHWTTPDFEVNLERGTVFSAYSPGSYARAGCPSQREAFRGSHGDLALWEFNRVKRIYDRYVAGEPLPAGPVIDGHETVTGDIRLSDTFRQTMIIDRQTGALRRIANHDATGHETTVDYSIWEMIPAGGSAANLAGTLPATGLEIRPAEDCDQIAPFPAGTP